MAIYMGGFMQFQIHYPLIACHAFVILIEIILNNYFE